MSTTYLTGMLDTQLEPAIVEFASPDEPVLCNDCEARPAVHAVDLFCGCTDLYCTECLSDLLVLLSQLIGYTMECTKRGMAGIKLTKISDYIKSTRRL